MSDFTVDNRTYLRGEGSYSELFKEYMVCLEHGVTVECSVSDYEGRPWRTDRLDAQVLAYSAKHLKLEVSLVEGDDPLLQELNPRADGMGFGTLASFHRRYDFNESVMREDWFDGWDDMYRFIMTPEDEEFSEYLGEGLGALAALPVYMLDHSGLAFSTSPFSCRWDSGQIGFIYATKRDIKELSLDENDVKAIETQLRQAIEVYDQWQRGEVWEYRVHDSTGSLAVGEDTLDAVSGFFSQDDCRDQGEESLQQCRADLYKRVRKLLPLPGL